MASTHITPHGRVSFESVYHPTAMEEGQEKKFGLTLLFPKELADPQQVALLKRMHELANQLSKEKFGVGLGERDAGGKIIKSPFRDGAEKVHLAGYDDTIRFVRFSGRIKPNVVDQKRSPIAEGEGFYSGCWAHVVYTVYTYAKVNKGVGFGLGNVQKVADGEPFGAALTPVEDDFDVMAGGTELGDLDTAFSDTASEEVPF